MLMNGMISCEKRDLVQAFMMLLKNKIPKQIFSPCC